MHHGILGQRWGDKNGPPYPLTPANRSATEKKSSKTRKKKSMSIKGKLMIMYGAGTAGGLIGGVYGGPIGAFIGATIGTTSVYALNNRKAVVAKGKKLVEELGDTSIYKDKTKKAVNK